MGGAWRKTRRNGWCLALPLRFVVARPARPAGEEISGGKYCHWDKDQILEPISLHGRPPVRTSATNANTAIVSHVTIHPAIAASNRRWRRDFPARSCRYLREEKISMPPSIPFNCSSSSSLSFHKSRCFPSRLKIWNRKRFAPAKMTLPQGWVSV